MPDITPEDIEKFEVDFILNYKGYKIHNYRFNDTFILAIYNPDGTIKSEKIITDNNFNECLMLFHNITLKPYIQYFLAEAENNLPKK